MSNKMNKVKALFSAVKSLFEEMHSANSSEGLVFWEDDLEVGTVLYTETGVAGDGDYAIMDNVYTVKDGIVVEIRPNNAEAPMPEPTPEPEPNAEMGCGDKQKMAEDEVVEVIPADEPVVVEEPKEEVKVEYATKEDIDEIKSAIEEFKAMLSEVEDRITAVDSRVTDIEGKPASGMPQDEFKKVVGDLTGIEAVKAMRKASRIK